ncbi:unnamed protein product [Clonostachys chloroleuca]|uniref:Uncharacterized protein n=1 Tax=Clonostachys chloroleuca TaxID=1926264 RepID=A0AA35M7U7_9HYPO|nr:unnamed protein product [Clonostachys chloroleuca]
MRLGTLAYTRSWAVWGDDFVQAWMGCTMESRAAFYVQIFAASSHYQLQRRGALSSADPLVTIRQRSKALAIEKLRSEVEVQLRYPSKPVPDALMMTIFTLAVHDSIDVSSSIRDSLEGGMEEAVVPIGYLAKCRDMQIYSWVHFGKEHMDMLVKLFEQSGGMTAINGSLFSIVLPLNDLSPRVPCQWGLRNLRHPKAWRPDDKAIEMLLVAGSYFGQPKKDSLTSSGLRLDRQMCETVSVLAGCSVVLDHIQRVGPEVVMDPHVWMGNCNWACHKLLSLGALLPATREIYSEPEGEEKRALDVSAYCSELCRLAALLYFDQIIFPTFNPQAEIKSRLTGRLLDLLGAVQEGIDSHEWAMVCDLARWAALIGAISSMAVGLTVMDRYVTFIANHCMGDAMYWGWEAVRERLVSFLWVQNLDQRGQKIWQRTCETIKLKQKTAT